MTVRLKADPTYDLSIVRGVRLQPDCFSRTVR